MSDIKRIALPSLAAGGLNSERSDHFGHCDCFTVVDVAEGQVVSVQTIENPPHAEGGCLAPVALLSSAGVDALVVAGMGMRPLAGFAEVGIRVFFEDETPRVGSVVEMMIAGDLAEMDPGAACSGGCQH
jgi:predicted Fe-Mo cluster-binding NifX family protein